MKLFSRHQPEAPTRRQSFIPRVPDKTIEKDPGYQAFRRGRTLTGSASSLIRSTNETQADIKSSRVHTHSLTKKRRHVGGLLLLTLAVACIFGVLLYQFTAHVEVQATPDTSLQLDDTYRKAITTYLADHPAERLRPLMNSVRLTDYLESIAPEVQTVAIKGSAGLGTTLIEISLRRPVASWNISSEQLYVDDSGVPFSRNYFGSPPLSITDRSGIPVAKGQIVASNRFMGFVGQVIGKSKAEGHTVTDIVIPPGMTHQIEVHLSGVGYPIKISSDRTAGEQVEDMMRAVGWMSKRKLTPEYIDVRVQGKVYYR